MGMEILRFSASIDIMARALAQTLSCIKLQIDDQIAADPAATFEATQAASRFDANTSVARWRAWCRQSLMRVKERKSAPPNVLSAGLVEE
jgi:hypothetical protein